MIISNELRCVRTSGIGLDALYDIYVDNELTLHNVSFDMAMRFIATEELEAELTTDEKENK